MKESVENTMKLVTEERSDDHLLENVSAGVSQFAMGLIIVLAALVGIWGILCLVSGLVGSGSGGLAMGWLTALGF